MKEQRDVVQRRQRRLEERFETRKFVEEQRKTCSKVLARNYTTIVRRWCGSERRGRAESKLCSRRHHGKPQPQSFETQVTDKGAATRVSIAELVCAAESSEFWGLDSVDQTFLKLRSDKLCSSYQNEIQVSSLSRRRSTV